MLQLWTDEPALVLARGTGHSHRFPRHWHDELHVCVYTAGRGYMRARGETRRVGANSVVVTPPGEVHENWVDAGESCSFIGAYLSAVGNVGWIHDDPAIARAIHRLHEPEPDRLSRDERLLGLRVALSGRRVVRRERFAVRKVRELIDDRFADALTLAELAAHVGTSPFHLCRVFAHEIGMGPHAYQTQVRLNRAKELLRAKLPIAEVAARAGFADQSHLHRHFRRHVGVTPGRYCR